MSRKSPIRPLQAKSISRDSIRSGFFRDSLIELEHLYGYEHSLSYLFRDLPVMSDIDDMLAGGSIVLKNIGQYDVVKKIWERLPSQITNRMCPSLCESMAFMILLINDNSNIHEYMVEPILCVPVRSFAFSGFCQSVPDIDISQNFSELFRELAIGNVDLNLSSEEGLNCGDVESDNVTCKSTIYHRNWAGVISEYEVHLKRGIISEIILTYSRSKSAEVVKVMGLKPVGRVSGFIA